MGAPEQFTLDELIPQATVLCDVIARAIEPRKAITVSEWADAKRSLSSKSSPKPGRWRTNNNPPLREPMDCMSVRSPVQDIVLMFPIQFGKALALDTPVPTPTGWTTMGGIKPGDLVFDETGRPVSVLAVSPVFVGHPCYRVAFSDGAEIIADAGHRWTVDNERHYHRRARVTLTTDVIADTYRHGRQNCYAIPLPAALELPEAGLPIDPYTLGVWLGDGNSHAAQLTLNESDAAEIVARIEWAGYRCTVRKLAYAADRGVAALNVMIDPKRTAEGASFHLRLQQVSLLGNKHIPPLYLRASRAQRLALLHGLMDTDGYAPKRGATMEISSSIPALAAGIVELLHSLGYKPVARTVPTAGKPATRITFTAYADQLPFSISRKAARVQGREGRRVSESSRRRIVLVEPVPSVPTRCIAVASVSRLYLAGRHMVPTHNSEIETNALGYIMDQAPGPVMVGLPGEVSMNKWINQKLNPLIEETAAVRESLTSNNSRNAANQKEFKDFAGGQLYVEHAGTAARLKQTTVRYLLVDELTEFANALRTGDDPLKMLEGRTSAFPDRYKRLYVSTPGVKGACRISEMWERSDQRLYHVDCPHCGHSQPLEWDGLIWPQHATAETLDRAWYVCRDCGTMIEEHHKTQMLRDEKAGGTARWVPMRPGRRMRGYHINCLYYQIGMGPRWLDLARMWLEAQGDPAALKTFTNDRKALPWEDRSLKNVRANLIQDRAEPYPLFFAPMGVVWITAGVDTQDDRLEVQIVGWARGRRAFILGYAVLTGDPQHEEVWTELTDLINRGIRHACGRVLPISATAIDGRGHRTQAVKDYTRKGLIRRPMPIFGAKAANAVPLSKPKIEDTDHKGKADHTGNALRSWTVGTIAIKHTLYRRLAADAEEQQGRADDAPLDLSRRYFRFSDQLPDGYFAGLVAEIFDPAKGRYVKRKGAARNEPLDTLVYAWAATQHPELQLEKKSAKDWEADEQRILNGAPALPADGEPPASQACAMPAPAEVPVPPAAAVEQAVESSLAVAPSATPQPQASPRRARRAATSRYLNNR